MVHSKTAKAIIANPDVCRAEINGMRAWVLYCAGMGGRNAANLATRFDTIKNFFSSPCWSKRATVKKVFFTFLNGGHNFAAIL